MTPRDIEWKRLKLVASIKGGAGFPHHEQGLRDEELPFYKVGALESASDDGLLAEADHFISRATAERLGAHVFSPGTVVFAKVGAALLLNRFRRLKTEACLDNNMMGLEAQHTRLDQRFLCYAMSAKDLADIANPGAVPSVNASQIAEESIWCPTLEEQQRIANFLDEKTARIDALIAEEERICEASKELFRSRLGSAVVQGFGVRGQMVSARDKGFDSVREDWSLIPLKYLALSSGGMTPSKDKASYWDGNVPWVSPKDMKVFVLNGSTDHVTEEALAATGLKLNAAYSVLVVVRGMILAHTFPVAMNAIPVTVNQDMKVLRPTRLVTSKYLAWLLRGLQPLMLSLTEESAHGTKALRTDQWANQPVPVPPIREQLELVALFETWQRESESLIAHLQVHIDKLREYRSSLISAAVTGRYDVSACEETA